VPGPAADTATVSEWSLRTGIVPFHLNASSSNQTLHLPVLGINFTGNRKDFKRSILKFQLEMLVLFPNK